MIHVRTIDDLDVAYAGDGEGLTYAPFDEAEPGDLVVANPSGRKGGTRLGVVLGAEPTRGYHMRVTAALPPNQTVRLIQKLESVDGKLPIAVSDLRPEALLWDGGLAAAVRYCAAARALARGVHRRTVEVFLAIAVGEFPRVDPQVRSDSLPVVSWLARPQFPTTSGARQIEVGRADLAGLFGALLEDNDVSSLQAGDLACSVLIRPRSQSAELDLGGLEHRLWTQLTGAANAGVVRPELEGAFEHRASGVLPAIFRGHVRPDLPFDVCIARPIEVPVEPGGSRRLPAWQIALYFDPPEVAGWRLNSVPPVTWLVGVVNDPAEAAELSLVLELLAQGRGRVFGDEYTRHVPDGSDNALPVPWCSEELEQAVGLIHDPTRPLLAAREASGSAKRIEQLFFAAVAAKAELIKQQLALTQRTDGATWKTSLYERDLQHLYGDILTPVNQEPVYPLLSPVRHHVSQLAQVSGHLASLGDRSEELFTLLSTHANRELLSRTDGAKRAAIVVGSITGFLAIVGTFATLAAIPAKERLVEPLVRAMDIIGLVSLLAIAIGIAAGAAAQHAAAVDPLLPEVDKLAPLRDPVAVGRWPEVSLVVAAASVLVLVIFFPQAWLLLLAVFLIAAAIGRHLYIERF